MAILILFIAGKTPTYPLPQDWGKKVVTILSYLIGAILKRGRQPYGVSAVAGARGKGAWKIGRQFRSITATFAVMALRHGILIEKRGACY
jgi:hypothetical protein